MFDIFQPNSRSLTGLTIRKNAIEIVENSQRRVRITKCGQMSLVVKSVVRTTYQDSYVHFELLPADSDDNKFVDCAVASNAEYIVSNDRHFNPLKQIPWPKVEVIKLVDFIKF